VSRNAASTASSTRASCAARGKVESCLSTEPTWRACVVTRAADGPGFANRADQCRHPGLPRLRGSSRSVGSDRSRRSRPSPAVMASCPYPSLAPAAQSLPSRRRAMRPSPSAPGGRAGSSHLHAATCHLRSPMSHRGTSSCPSTSCSGQQIPRRRPIHCARMTVWPRADTTSRIIFRTLSGSASCRDPLAQSGPAWRGSARARERSEMTIADAPFWRGGDALVAVVRRVVSVLASSAQSADLHSSGRAREANPLDGLCADRVQAFGLAAGAQVTGSRPHEGALPHRWQTMPLRNSAPTGPVGRHGERPGSLLSKLTVATPSDAGARE
jgi:hypothetical protein